MFLKVVSFDLECRPINGQMPDPTKDCPILLISCAFNHDIEYEVDDNVVKCNKLLFLLGREKKVVKLDVKTDSEGDSVLVVFDDEKLMIETFFGIIRDNDVVIGYNSNGFDFPYICDRSKTLGIKDIRVGNGKAGMFYRKHLSKGMTVVNVGGLTGKIVFDVLYLLRREDSSNSFKQEGRYNLKRLTLRDVAREILGKEKLDFSIEDIERYWTEGCSFDLGMRMVEYGIRDSELPLELFRKFRLIDRFFTLSRRSGKLVGDVINSMGSGLMVENLLMKENRKEGRVTPCRSKTKGGDDSDDELGGAEVFEPKVGVHENVCSGDYLSLYPSLMIRHNLCYTTVVHGNGNECDKSEYIVNVDDNELITGSFIKKEIYEGIIPRILKGLLDERAYWKKEMKKYEKGTSEYLLYDATQNAVKILLNSFYGYSGDSTSKTYDLMVASSVTGNGRKQIKKTKEIILDIGLIEHNANKFILDVIQGDTDSSYIEVKKVDIRKVNVDEKYYDEDRKVEVIENVNKEVIEIDKEYDITRDECIYCVKYLIDKVNMTLEKPMELAFENYIKRIFIVAKKHYAYVSIDDKGRKSITSKGMENIRRDWSNLATETVSKMIDYILMEDKVENGINKCVDYVKDVGKSLLDGRVGIEKLILTKKLTKAITEYDGKQAHVMVAKNMVKRGKSVSIGDRIEYVITDNGKELINEKAEDWRYVVENGLKMDYNYYVNRQLIPPSMRILGLLGISEETIVSGIDGKQDSLDMFWSNDDVESGNGND